ncbi:MAG: glycosyltransferase family 4 protein [Firmicutes bacterium]|nr:glycosyltransferase family 4 protein [Bacillota bacterium]MDY6161457.1 glycosyltransferase family 4 protein [Candidatus Faecousia sp.]
MNVLFIALAWPKPGEPNLYTDLMDEFVAAGDQVCVATLCEKRNGLDTHLREENGMQVLRVKCGNIQKTNKYEKVISSFVGGYLLERAVNRYFGDRQFDVIIFALPPLTITLPLIRIKKRFHSKLYVLLKEFWPQDPADMGAMSVGGAVWKVFRYLEKKLYEHSDYIGTMSEAGAEYIRKTFPQLDCQLEVCPNSEKFKPQNWVAPEARKRWREKFGIQETDCAFVFGGNLGLSQGIPEMIECIRAASDIKDVKFVIVGDGTEKDKLFHALEHQENVLLFDWLPKEDYDTLVDACDVGMLFLYPKYTVPNIPSRLVSYLLSGLPVVACVDPANDIGKILSEHNCGVSMINGDTEGFREAVILMKNAEKRKELGENSRKLFESDYTARRGYEIISAHFQNSGDRH